MNEIDVMKKALADSDDAVKLKNMNEELMQHLSGSVYWLIKYSEKYNITLPKKEELIRMVEKADLMINQMTQRADPTIFDKENFRRRLDRTRAADTKAKEEQKEEIDALLGQEGDAHSQEPVYS